MKILVAAFAYNERPYIPYMVEYYRSQGCDLLILDNYSTDGTYEWLVENKVNTMRVDTKDTFHLVMLQKALLHQLKKEMPDWLVYTGVDTYYYFTGTIKEEVEKAVATGCTIIEVNHVEIHNSGEPFGLPFQQHYFYMAGGVFRRRQMIAQYRTNLNFNGDRVIISDSRVYQSNGFLVNYGMCKLKEEREVTFERRKRAWTLGNPKGQGVHYYTAQQKDWIWKKEELIDVRTTEYYKMMTK